MGPREKLYVAVRGDLIPGLQAAQAAHAAIQFCFEHPDVAKYWTENSNYIGILQVPDESSLISLMNEAETQGIYMSAFREPDLDDEFTAVAFEPCTASRELCQDLPLALVEYAMS
jgi:peptidyl-tRNA hydrolase